MHRTLTFAFVTYLLIISHFANSQSAICGFDRVYHNRLKDPEIARSLREINSAVREREAQIRNARILNRNTSVIGSGLYEIPVVVHVIYRPSDALGSQYNPTDANIQSMIDHLNEVYTAGNSYNTGASLPFRFKLAQRSPSCGATTGIERIDGSSLPDYITEGISLPGSGAAGASEVSMKALSLWSVSTYYNIWVVWKINSVGLSANSYIAGYADLPYSTGINGSDGAVLNGRIVNGTSSTLPHEMGHAMGLLHTFEGGDADNCPATETSSTCSTIGDLVCDTDPVKNLLSAGSIADNVINPCTNLFYNGSQKNIMGYGSGLNRFTQGQSDRALATFQVTRTGFITSIGSQAANGDIAKSSVVPPAIVNIDNNNNMGPCSIALNTLLSSTMGYDKYAQDYYIDNSCNIGTKLSANESYPLSVSTQTNRQACKAWIDFNNDGIFDNSEIVMNSSATTATYTHTSTITSTRLSSTGVVYGAKLRMRVAADFYTNINFTATSQLNYGQMEDYYVVIEAPIPAVFNSVAASIKSNNLYINWTTSSEVNNDKFVVEISNNGTTFKELATLASNSSGGNSASALSYSITKNAGEVNTLLGGWLIVLFVLGIILYKKNKWLLYATTIFMFGFLPMNACKKKDVGIKADQLFIRIKTISKGGFVLYSNVVKAIKE